MNSNKQTFLTFTPWNANVFSFFSPLILKNKEDGEEREKRKFLYPKGSSNLWPGGIIYYTFASDERRFGMW